MSSRSRKFRSLAWTLVLTTTFVCALQTGASALIAPAFPPQAAPAAPERTADLKTIQGALESKVLRQRLKELGLSDKEIELRLGKLSDQQVHQIATRMHSVNPGGDLSVAGLLLLVALVLVIIYLAKRV